MVRRPLHRVATLALAAGVVLLSCQPGELIAPAENLLPTATVTAPTAGASLIQGTATQVAATASDADGTVTAVEFFDGATSLGTDGTAPYSVTWTPGTLGGHTITARSTDNSGATTTSAAVSVTVVLPPNQPPTVSVTAPPAGATATQGTATPVTATASDADGTVTTVEFFDGATSLGTDNSAPYAVSWTPSTLGAHSLTARATDNSGAATTSAAVSVTVAAPANRPPTVSITAPPANATITQGTATQVTAIAADSDGTVASVQFFDGAASFGTDGTAPYARAWTPTTLGAHSLTARATDNSGASTTSAAVSVTVVAPANQPPAVSVTAPTAGASITQGTATPVTATASDADGTVASVEFFDGATSLGTDSTAPYAGTWTPSTLGAHSLTARATDSGGATTTSAAVSVTVVPPANQPPTATITAPPAGTLFSGGDTISYAGTGTDPEDGVLAGNRFTWWVDLHHATHTHPFMPPTTGSKSGSFVVPPRGHTEDNIFLRIYLAVVDTNGVADTTYVDVQPRKVTLSFVSAPAGASLTLDGQPQVAPFSVTGVVGMERDLGATSPQTVGADSLEWLSWSDGGAALHTVVTPATNATYTATYRIVVVVNLHPTVSVTSPLAGATIIQGTATSITASASDPDGTVTSVRFFDGPTSLGVDNTAPYGITWTPTTTGAHTLTARATDNQGDSTTSTAIAVTVIPAGVDGTPPTVQLTSPTDGTTDLSGSQTLTASATDNVGVVGVTFQVDGVTLSEDLSAPYSALLPATSPYTTGVHVIRARARDAAGNLSAWSAARVTFAGSALPAGFSRTQFVSGITSGRATTMAFAPDGRLFIAEQDGALRVVKNGSMLPTPFVTVNTSANGERGLLGVAFHPQFATNGWIYLYYTSGAGGAHNRIVRYTANGDVAGSAESVLVDLPNLSSATNHNGGAMHFGPDGKLYVAVGDNATGTNAQSLSTPFGKMLRFNDDGTIPVDNPFFGSTSGINRSIWALGLRNPFTFAFEPGTGRMLINDVGENTWEEINSGAAGANYGWPLREGAGGAPTYVDPIYVYRHSSSNNPSLVVGFSIVGAAFYGPSASLFPPEYQGNYFFADYVSGWVNRLDAANGNAVYAFWNWGQAMTDVAVGPDGALYVLGDLGGSWGVHRIGRP